jgi:hypothetical protein
MRLWTSFWIKTLTSEMSQENGATAGLIVADERRRDSEPRLVRTRAWRAGRCSRWVDGKGTGSNVSAEYFSNDAQEAFQSEMALLISSTERETERDLVAQI